jgi:hypothetical protein
LVQSDIDWVDMMLSCQSAGEFNEYAIRALRQGLDITAQGTKGTVAASAFAAASRLFYNLAEADTDRLEVLKVTAKALRSGRVDGRVPEAEAHWMCAKAYNLSTSYMRMRNRKFAQLFMQVTVELATLTKCEAITADMCESTARRWSMQVAEDLHS